MPKPDELKKSIYYHDVTEAQADALLTSEQGEGTRAVIIPCDQNNPLKQHFLHIRFIQQKHHPFKMDSVLIPDFEGEVSAETTRQTCIGLEHIFGYPMKATQDIPSYLNEIVSQLNEDDPGCQQVTFIKNKDAFDNSNSTWVTCQNDKVCEFYLEEKPPGTCVILTIPNNKYFLEIKIKVGDIFIQSVMVPNFPGPAQPHHLQALREIKELGTDYKIDYTMGYPLKHQHFDDNMASIISDLKKEFHELKDFNFSKKTELQLYEEKEYKRLSQPTNCFINIGKHGLIQYHFKNDNDASKFHRFLKSNDKLRETGIAKAKIKLEKNLFESKHQTQNHVLRLSKVQFDHLYGEHSYNTLIKLLELANSEKWTELVALFVTASSEVINHALVMFTNKERPLLTTLISLAPLSTQVIDKILSADSLNYALTLKKESDNESALEYAFRYQSPETVSKLLDQLNQETLDKILLMRKKARPWLYAVCFQSAEVNLKIIQKASPQVLSQGLSLVENDELCLLHRAAYYLPSFIFIQLLEKCDSVSVALAAMIKHKDTYAMLTAASEQTPAGFLALIEKLNSTEAAREKVRDELKSLPREELGKLFIKIVLHQPFEVHKAWLALINNTNKMALCRYLEENAHSVEVRAALRAMKIKNKGNIFSHLHFLTEEDVTIILNKYPPLLLQPELKLPQNVSEIKFPEDQKVLELFRNGQAVVKIIREDKGKEKNITDFLDTLGNYSDRQKIRIDTEKKGYKLVYFTPRFNQASHNAIYTFPHGFIVKCRSPEEQKLHKNSKRLARYKTTKKTPATYISKFLHTGIFGRGDPNRELVGFVFKLEPENIKAMFSHDVGTFLRRWVNDNLLTLIGFASSGQNITYSDLNQFVTCIDNQPYVCNEILVKLSIASMQAIVIAKDTAEARKIAEVRQNRIFNKFHKDLPIVIYDNERQQVTLFHTQSQIDRRFKHEIHADKMVHACEYQAKVKLLKLKATIKSLSSIKMKLFDNIKFSFPDFPETLPVTTVKKIKSLIKEAEKNEKTFRQADNMIIELIKADADLKKKLTVAA